MKDYFFEIVICNYLILIYYIQADKQNNRLAKTRNKVTEDVQRLQHFCLKDTRPFSKTFSLALLANLINA